MDTALRRLGLLTLLMLALSAQVHADPVTGSAFTFQGMLTRSGEYYSGACDFTATLFDAPTAGNQIGATLTLAGVPVSNGQFALALDFGAGAITGQRNWLAPSVRCTGDSAYTELPRVEVTPAPMAYWSQSASTAITSTVATSATYAVTASTATTATMAHAADTVPWAGITGAPEIDNGIVYTAGSGITITPQYTVSLASGYQLPQTCEAGQITYWTGSAWGCTGDATNGSGSITGGGTVATGGYTLTVPGTGTAAEYTSNTTGYLPVWSSGVLVDSRLRDNGTTASIGAVSPVANAGVNFLHTYVTDPGSSNYGGQWITQVDPAASTSSGWIGFNSQLQTSANRNFISSSGGMVAASSSVRSAGTGLITLAISDKALCLMSGGGSMAECRDYSATSPSLTGGSTITTATGVYVAAQKVTGVTTGYGIYQAGASDANYLAGRTGISTTASATYALQVGGSSSIYANGNISADSFTDRTAWCDGCDALTLLSGIRGLTNAGLIDHSTLPIFARRSIVHTEVITETGQISTTVEDGRDIGAMVTLLTIGQQQLDGRFRVLAPAHSYTPCTRGQYATDQTYLYVCTLRDTWRRIAYQSGTW